VATQAYLDSLPRFLLLGWDHSFPAGFKSAELFGKAVFPNHRVTRITGDLSIVERQ
jgi:hypothetical protein